MTVMQLKECKFSTCVFSLIVFIQNRISAAKQKELVIRSITNRKINRHKEKVKPNIDDR